MASARTVLVSLLAVSVILFDLTLVEPHTLLESNSESVSNEVVGSLLRTTDCGGACRVRCSKSSRPHLCKRACGTCCVRCGCVPPGTYENYNVCPCYATLTTHGGRRKCP